MPKHIGIVGVSAEGAALCYRTICIEGAALMGPHAHPEITMHTFSLSAYVASLEGGRWQEVASLLLASAGILHRAGADFLICPDNTVHPAVNLIREESPLPWLHIAEEVAAVAAARGFRRLLVLGTSYLMESTVYPEKLGPAGIQCETPDAGQRARVNSIIFDQLVYGRFESPARSFVSGLIAEAGARGVDAVVLGCTELPLLIGDGDSSLPTLDSARILARAALREAVA